MWASTALQCMAQVRRECLWGLLARKDRVSRHEEVVDASGGVFEGEAQPEY